MTSVPEKTANEETASEKRASEKRANEERANEERASEETNGEEPGAETVEAPASVVGLALVALCCAPLFAVKIKSWDVWWHLATGRWIVEHGQLPTVDPFTYTMAGKPWHLVNGIAEVVLYAFHSLGGVAGVVAAKLVFAWLTLLFIGLSLRELRVGRRLSLLLVAACALLLQARYSLARPLIMGAALVAAGSWLSLHNLRQPRRSAALYFFVLTLPIWPLVHGTALVGLAQLVALCVAMGLQRELRPRLRRALLVLAACLFVSLCLAWWRDLFGVVAGLQGGATATSFTAEWASGLEAMADHAGRWLVMVGGVVGGAVALAHGRGWLLLLLSLLAAVLALRFGRNAYEGVILSAPALGYALFALSDALKRRQRQLLATVAPLAVVIVCAAVQLLSAPRRTINRPFGFSVDRSRYPYDTLQTARKLPGARMINGFPLGGFLIWTQGPWGVYSDGRTVALYSEADVAELFVPLLKSAEALTAAADRWGAQLGLTEHLSIPNQWMIVSPQWVPLHLGSGTALFARRTLLGQLPRGVRPLHLLRYTSDQRWTSGWYRGILARPDLRKQLAGDVAHAAALSPFNPILPKALAVIAEQDPPYAAALARIVERARRGH